VTSQHLACELLADEEDDDAERERFGEGDGMHELAREQADPVRPGEYAHQQEPGDRREPEPGGQSRTEVAERDERPDHEQVEPDDVHSLLRAVDGSVFQEKGNANSHPP